MAYRRSASPAASALALALSALALSACTYERDGPATLHFKEFKTVAPEGNTVTVCHAYGCQKQTAFTFTEDDLDRIGLLMESARQEETPREERRAMAHAVAWMERRVGARIGTDADRASIDILGSNDSSQQDCVDEATNATSYLMVLEQNGLLRHHTVGRPYAKGNLLLGVWPHWGAVVRETASGQRYVVDSSVGANGALPNVQVAERWYLDDAGSIKISAPRGAYIYPDDPAKDGDVAETKDRRRTTSAPQRAGRLTTGSVR